MQRRFVLRLAAVLGAASLFASLASVAQADETIKVGVTGGPHAQIMEVVKTVAAKNGLNIKIVEFSDYVQPNAALAGGDLDANSYQHDPYLQAQVKDRGLIEAAQAMGATTSQIVFKVLLPESLPGVVAGLTITFVSLVGYSAMAGAIGGGGLGDLGIRYRYQRFLPEVMVTVVVILIVFVQLVQSFGDWLVRRLSHK